MATKKSGNDPRGTIQNQVQQQQQRYENQQGPLANTMAYNYGRGSEANYGDYTDIMNQYRNIATGGGTTGGGGGGGGGWSASHIGYTDPFKSYAGYEDFSKTGGYSPQDIQNMRARGTSPVRAAYANAERELQRGRSLQGGYSPNMAAAQVKMAREQSQGMADAMQGVEAGLSEARNKGRLAGLGGMSGIETSRLGADLDVAKFNAQADMSAAASNSAAASRAAELNAEQRMQALRGMTTLYGTSPAMAELFGGQALSAVGQGGQIGLGLTSQLNTGVQQKGAYDQNMGRVRDAVDIGSRAVYPWLPDERQKRQPQPVNYDYSDQNY